MIPEDDPPEYPEETPPTEWPDELPILDPPPQPGGWEEGGWQWP